MRVFLNNSRTFKSYFDHPHHHDFMLANQCMACAMDDQEKIHDPETGDLVAIYTDGIGVVAFGYASDDIAYVNDDRVGGCETMVRRLDQFTMIACPIKHTEFDTGVRGTLHEVLTGTNEFVACLTHRALPKPDDTLFETAKAVG